MILRTISFFIPDFSISRVGDFEVAISGGIEVAVRGRVLMKSASWAEVRRRFILTMVATFLRMAAPTLGFSFKMASNPVLVTAQMLVLVRAPTVADRVYSSVTDHFADQPVFGQCGDVHRFSRQGDFFIYSQGPLDDKTY